MKKFYVSLVKDLIGYYIEFNAESETAVRQYLVNEYFDEKHLIWKLPWMSVYESVTSHEGVRGVIKATCGNLYEDKS